MSEKERYLTLFEKQFEIRDKLLKAKKGLIITPLTIVLIILNTSFFFLFMDYI